jgi:glyoxylase-like metal-dependent hydrolase (beta-lactamase superfamily II)
VVRVRADNPSPLTLGGTNTYVVGGWVVDPGPADPRHLDAVLAAAGGAVHGVVLTHGHPDHAEGAPGLAERAGGVPIVRPGEGERVGPLTAVSLPGHTREHVGLVWGRVGFTGDAVLGAGSVFISVEGGGLAAYLAALRRLRAMGLATLLPGHGPVIGEPAAKLDEYIDHRLDRERRLLAALGEGAGTREELLDRVWADVPAGLRPAAAVTLEAHLEKLREEGRLARSVA